MILKRFNTLISFSLLSLFAYLYAFLSREFAEIHIQLPVLSFPIFIGEILLAVCLGLLTYSFIVEKYKLNKWHLLIFCYLGWILLRAFQGYSAYGPLAFRNAALFYYPLFAVIGYYCYDSRLFKPKVIVTMLIGLVVAMKFCHIFAYHRYALFVLYLILVFKLKNPWVKIIFLGLLIVLYPFKHFFLTARSHLVSFAVVLGYLYVVGFYGVFQISKKIKVIWSGLLIVGLLLGYMCYPDKQAVHSLFMFKSLSAMYQEKLTRVKEQEQYFEFQPISTRLYNKDNTGLTSEGLDTSLDMILYEIKQNADVSQVSSPQASVDMMDLDTLIQQKYEFFREQLINISKRQLFKVKLNQISIEEATEATIEDADLVAKQIMTEVDEFFTLELSRKNDFTEEGRLTDDQLEYKKIFLKSIAFRMERMKYLGLNADFMTLDKRETEVETGNIIFRAFVWRDMINDMKESRSIWGINWGRPQRSKSLEILNWAGHEWKRDGWIAPHNSWLHMVYRGGIIAGLFILSALTVFIFMVRRIIMARSIKGLFLSSMIVYMVVVSLFLVILELPHNAIPFWSLFGITLAYSLNLKRSDENSYSS